MANASQYTFSFEEVVTSLIKQQDISEGLWALSLNFKFEAKNVRMDANRKDVNPGFIGFVQHIGIVRVEKSIPGITVDAAKVNPKLARGPRTKLN
ncbi:hypothetical protein [Dyella psychrodurans]|uniref:Uncharacterized protein n=1 Tax=Dyella psychrodurans TaxID=1927960 RepID=A0A370WZ78_9GAMM|nr:hypothetical protein [Dyella psychrodurans]RDS81464.1 hypothetical protein DWU99_17505 [Dyella psychrodurans]